MGLPLWRSPSPMPSDATHSPSTCRRLAIRRRIRASPMHSQPRRSPNSTHSSQHTLLDLLRRASASPAAPVTYENSIRRNGDAPSLLPPARTERERILNAHLLHEDFRRMASIERGVWRRALRDRDRVLSTVRNISEAVSLDDEQPRYTGTAGGLPMPFRLPRYIDRLWEVEFEHNAARDSTRDVIRDGIEGQGDRGSIGYDTATREWEVVASDIGIAACDLWDDDDNDNYGNGLASYSDWRAQEFGLLWEMSELRDRMEREQRDRVNRLRGLARRVRDDLTDESGTVLSYRL